MENLKLLFFVVQTRLLGSWCNCCAAERGIRHALQRFRRRIARIKVTRAFSSWVQVLVDAAVIRCREHHLDSVRLVLARRISNSCLAFMFSLWSEHCQVTMSVRAEESRLSDLEWKLAVLRLQRGLSRAFESWSRNVQDCKARTVVLTKMVAKGRQKRVAAALVLWRMLAVKWRRGRKTMSNVVQKWTHLALMRGWSGWMACVARAKADDQRKRVVQHIARRLSLRAVSLALCRWCAFASDARTEQAQQQCSLEGKRRCIKRILQQVLVASLNCWIDHVTQARATRQKTRVVAARWNREGLAAAFVSWEHVCYTSSYVKYTNAKIGAAVQKWARGSLTTSWCEWLEHVSENKRIRSVMSRHLWRVMNKTVCAAFSCLVQHCHHERNARKDRIAEERNTRIVAKVMKRKLAKRTAASIYCWKAFVFDARYIRYITAKSMKMAARVILAHLSNALEVWRDRVCQQQQVFKIISELLNRPLRDALVHWHEAVVESIRHQTLLLRLAARLAAWAIGSWCFQVVERKCMKAAARRVVLRVLAARLARAVWAWKHRWSVDKQVRKRCRQILHRWMKSSMGSVMAAWRCNGELSKCQRVQLRELETRTRLAIEKRAYITWYQHASELRQEQAQYEHHQRVIAKVVRRWVSMLMRIVWMKWDDQVVETRRQRLIMKKMAARLKDCEVYKAYVSWAENVEEVRGRRRVLKRMALKRNYMLINKGWKSWKRSSCASTRQRAVMRKVARRIMNSRAYWALNGWRQLTARMSRYRQVLLKVLHRMKHNLAARCMLCWVDHTVRAVRLYRIIAKWMHAAQGCVWFRWLDYVSALQRQRSVDDKALRRRTAEALARAWTAWVEWRHHVYEEARRRSKVRRNLQRLKNRALVESVEHWREEVTGERQMKAKALKVVQRLMNRALIDGFERWREDVVGERQMNAKALKVVQRLMNRVLIKAFDAWNQTIAEARLAADLMTVEIASERGGQAGAPSKEIGQWRNKKMNASFRAWSEVALQLVHARHTCQQVILKMRALTKAILFQTWADSVVENKRLKRGAEKIVRHWQRNAVAGSFAGWKSSLDEQKCLQGAADKIQTRRASLALASPYVRWRKNVAEKRALQQIMGKVVRRWQQTALVVSFRSWALHVVEQKQFKMTADKISLRWRMLGLARPWAVWDIQRRENRRLKRTAEIALQRWSKFRGLGVTFARWHHTWASCRDVQRKARKIVLRWQSVTLGAAFSRWKAHASGSLCLKKKARRVVLRWNRMPLVPAFSRWRQQCWMAMDARDRLMRWLSFLQGKTATSLTNYVAAWSDSSKRRLQLRAAAEKVAHNWLVHALSATIQTWITEVTGRKRVLALMHRIARRWCNTCTAMPLRTWRHNAGMSKRLTAIAAKLAVRWNRVRECGAWRRWVSFSTKSQQMVRLQCKAGRRWKHLTMSAAFVVWGYAIAAAQGEQQMLRKIARRWQHATLAAAWSRWQMAQDETGRLKSLQDHLVQAAACEARWALMLVFQAWVQSTQHCVYSRGLRMRVDLHMRNLSLNFAFEAWKRRVQDMKRLQCRFHAACAHICQRIMKRAVASAYSTWSQHVMELKQLVRSCKRIARQLRRRAMVRAALCPFLAQRFVTALY